MATEQEEYDSLSAYTLAHRGSDFLHQHVVDALGAQRACEDTTPMQLAFALVGLYLYIERRYTGREVQRVHTQLAQRTRSFPRFALPATRGTVNAADVMAAPAGSERDAAIHRWCAAVWDAYRSNQASIVELLANYGIA
jgi:hypothetical protein